MELFTTFIKNESGAITVDWVILTAPVVGLGMAVVTLISGGINSATNVIDDGIKAAANNTIAEGMISGTTPD